jgi:hypothetical protein
MAGLVIVEGNVIGGHYLKDLGITVPYNEEITLDAGRATWSRDLNEAYRMGYVTKKKVLAGLTSPPRVTRAVPSKVVKPPAPPRKPVVAVPKASPKLPEVPTPGVEEGLGQETSKVDEYIETLKESNKKYQESNEILRKQHEAFLKNQEMLLERIDQLLSKPFTVSGNVTSTDASDSERETVDDGPMFIPSKIRRTDTKVSGGGADVTEERQEKAGLEATAQLLAQLKKQKEES